MRVLLLGPESRNVDVKNYLLSQNDEVILYNNKLSLDYLKENKIDFIISNGYAPIIKNPIISEYRNEIINMHISYLPYGKGLMPNVWSFFEGVPKGVSIHFIDKGTDTGNIIFQKQVEFSENETLITSHAKLIQILTDLLIEKWNDIRKNNFIIIDQKKLKVKVPYHNRKDSEKLMECFPERWNTPVTEVEALGRKYSFSIKSLLKNHDKKFYSIAIRHAELQDCRDVWEWWNDAVTRKMMLKNEIVEWDAHKAWYENMLEDKNRSAVIGLYGSRKIGIVRFDLQKDGIYDTSIYLNMEFRGKGYGLLLLRKAIDNFRKTHDAKIIFIMVKKTNISAIKTYEKTGFVLKDKPDFDCEGLKRFNLSAGYNPANILYLELCC